MLLAGFVLIAAQTGRSSATLPPQKRRQAKRPPNQPKISGPSNAALLAMSGFRLARAKGKSAMPQDVIKHLSKRDLRDLVEFLSRLRKPKREPATRKQSYESGRILQKSLSPTFLSELYMF